MITAHLRRSHSEDIEEEETMSVKDKEKSKELAVADPASKGELTYRPANRAMVFMPPSAELDVYEDMGDGTEATGLENIGMRERRIPLLRPLDPKSPQCNPPENGGIPGATGGTIFNVTTGEIYDRKLGLYMVPCLTDLMYPEYIKREPDGGGGGFLGIYEPNDPIVLKAQALRMKEHGNLFGKLFNGLTEDGRDRELVETHYLYGIMIRPNPDGSCPGEYGEFFPAGVPFASTQIKQHGAFVERSKNMKYPIRGRDGVVKKREVPMWSHVWHLKPHLEKRGSQTWWGWRFSLAAKKADGTEMDYQDSRLTRDSVLYQSAEELRTVILEGNAKIDFEKDVAGNQDGSDSTNNHSSGSGKDAEIPLEN